MLQDCLVLVICFLWRYLVRAWRRYPWKLVRAVDPAVPRTEREAAAKAFWDADDCELDSGVGRPLREHLCHTWEELLEGALADFLSIFFERAVVVSTFAERLFAELSSLCSARGRSLGLPTLTATFFNAQFAKAVEIAPLPIQAATFALLVCFQR